MCRLIAIRRELSAIRDEVSMLDLGVAGDIFPRHCIAIGAVADAGRAVEKLETALLD